MEKKVDTSKNDTIDEEPMLSVSSDGGAPKRTAQNSEKNDSLTMRIPKPRLPRRPQVNKSRLKAAALVVALLVSMGAGFFGGYLGAANRDRNGSSLSSQKQVVTSESQLISQIAKTVGPSVVSVDVVSQTAGASSAFDSFFGGGSTGQQESAGTGIILSADGLIITNRHVVPAGTTSVSVTLSDGTQLKNVQVLGRTSDSDSLDVAFLKVTDTKGHKLTPAVIGSSSKVQVGDAVVAIGNALGQFQNTITSGIISGYGRSFQAGDSSGQQSAENLTDLFQTDAAINEGNSGGPLVNLNGQVVGMNTAIASGSQNIGFAIPIDDITGLIKQVEATGKFQRPYLGVRYIALTADIAKQFDLDVTQGAFIPPRTDPASPAIIPGSPAEKAGLQANDVVTKIDGTTIDQTHSVTAILDRHNVGDKVTVTVNRAGKTLHLTATLATAPTS